MQIRKIRDKNTWEAFLSGCQEKSFLQSWNWGEFNKMMGEEIWRLGIYDQEKLIAVALTVKTIARRGVFLLIPHGPVVKSKIKNQKSKILKELLNYLKDPAKKEMIGFIRVSSIWERCPENMAIFKKLGFRDAALHTHPEASWVLDIRPSEEELLAGMRKTTRYLIRQAQKNPEIKIFQSQNVKDLDIFYQIHEQVVEKQRFVPFSHQYLRNEFRAFEKDNQVSLFFGKYRGKSVASALVLFWSGIGFYHHAGLLSSYRKLPIAYLLQWEAIKEAKRRGCHLYDFWGYVNPQKQPQHPWAGPTLFKMGFGGKARKYVQTQDLPLSSKYWLTFALEKTRRFKRRL